MYKQLKEEEHIACSKKENQLVIVNKLNPLQVENKDCIFVFDALTDTVKWNDSYVVKDSIQPENEKSLSGCIG